MCSRTESRQEDRCKLTREEFFLDWNAGEGRGNQRNRWAPVASFQAEAAVRIQVKGIKGLPCMDGPQHAGVIKELQVWLDMTVELGKNGPRRAFHSCARRKWSAFCKTGVPGAEFVGLWYFLHSTF